jgi:hypothetical protein
MSSTLDIYARLGYEEIDWERKYDLLLVNEALESLEDQTQSSGLVGKEPTQRVCYEARRRLIFEKQAMELVGRVAVFLVDYLREYPEEERNVETATRILHHSTLYKVLSTFRSVVLMELDAGQDLGPNTRAGDARAQDLQGCAALVTAALYKESQLSLQVRKGRILLGCCTIPWKLVAKAR